MSEKRGHLIDFFVTSDTLRIGVITAESPRKLAVTDLNGRQHNVAEKNVAVIHRERAETGRISSQAQALLEGIEELAREVDTTLLWHTAVEEAEEFSAYELARLYFGEDDCCRTSALWRAVLNDPIHFRLRGGVIQPRAAAQVTSQIHARKVQSEKEERRRRITEWLARVLSGEEAAQESPEEPEQEAVLRRMEVYLLQRQRDEEIEGWLSPLDPEGTARTVAYDILAALGRLPAAADPFLMTAGIESRFSRAALEQAESMVPFAPTPRRLDATQALVVAIDDEETREIDDAFDISRNAQGWTLRVHVADAAAFIDRDDSLDQEARRRISTLYLPQTTVRMLPDRLGCDLGSLVPGEIRPAFTLSADFTPAGALRDWSFQPSQIRVAERLTYEEADRILATEGDDPLSRSLADAAALARRLAGERAKAGAIEINRPELKITVRNADVQLKRIDTASPSRRLVSELMILVNCCASSLCRKREIPFIFRSQNRPDDLPKISTEYQPLAAFEALSRMERSRYSTEPGAHGGLGVPSYTQLTSPLRRFTDLVLQRQLKAAVQGEAPPYSREELMEVIETVQAAEGDLRAAERKANRFYTLTFISRQPPDEVVEVVVLRQLERGYLVETGDWFVRAMLNTSLELTPGTRLRARVEWVNPARNQLVYVPVP